MTDVIPSTYPESRYPNAATAAAERDAPSVLASVPAPRAARST